MLDSIQAFIAVNLEVAAMRRVAALQRSLRTSPEAPSQVAWVAPTNLHVGLRVLGTVDPAIAPAINDGIRELVHASPPIRVRLAGPEPFPRLEHARLVVVHATDGTGALDQLASEIESLAQTFGFPSQTGEVRPHVVLARLAEAVDVTRWFASLGRSELGDAHATECVLYHSGLDRPGAEFASLGRVGFNVPAAGRSHRPRARAPSQRPGSRSKPPAGGVRAKADEIPPPPKVPDLSSSGGGESKGPKE